MFVFIPMSHLNIWTILQILLLKGLLLTEGVVKTCYQPYGSLMCDVRCLGTDGCSNHVFDEVQLTCQLIINQSDGNLYPKKENAPRCPKEVGINFIEACKFAELYEVKRLLQLKLADINCIGESNDTCIMRAAEKNKRHLVDFLLHNECDLSAVDDQNRNALHFACMGSSYSTVKKLVVDYGSDIHSKDTNGQTPMMYTKSIDIVQFLVERGADVKAVNAYNNTILHLACKNGNEDIVKYVLLLRILDIESKGEGGRTPLLIAARYAKQQVMTLLITNGAGTKAVDDVKNNILHAVCQGGGIYRVAYVLSLKVFDIDCKGEHGRTPFMMAVVHHHINVFEYLLKHQAKMAATDNDGLSIIHIVCLIGDKRMVKYLLRRKAFRVLLKRPDNYGNTPAQLANKGGHHDIEALLNSRYKVYLSKSNK